MKQEAKLPYLLECLQKTPPPARPLPLPRGTLHQPAAISHASIPFLFLFRAWLPSLGALEILTRQCVSMTGMPLPHSSAPRCLEWSSDLQE